MAKQELIAYERKEASSQQQNKMTDNFAFTMSTLDIHYTCRSAQSASKILNFGAKNDILQIFENF